MRLPPKLELLKKTQSSLFVFFLGSLQETVYRDVDGLQAVCMDQAQLGDKPLTVFKTIGCFLVFILIFISSEVLQRLPLYMFIEQPSCKYFGDYRKPSGKFFQGFSGYCQPSDNFVIESQGVFCNPLTFSSEDVDNFCI